MSRVRVPANRDRSENDPLPGRRLFDGRTWQRVAKALRLSDRELQIVQCIFDSKAEPAIAEELRISAHTVHSHLERLYRKLDVHERTGLTVRVFATYLSFQSDR
jgi:DNA-binding NarL/FixJ family response regulator